MVPHGRFCLSKVLCSLSFLICFERWNVQFWQCWFETGKASENWWFFRQLCHKRELLEIQANCWKSQGFRDLLARFSGGAQILIVYTYLDMNSEPSMSSFQRLFKLMFYTTFGLVATLSVLVRKVIDFRKHLLSQINIAKTGNSTFGKRPKSQGYGALLRGRISHLAPCRKVV